MNKITRKSEVKPLSAGQMFNVNDKLFALIEKNHSFTDNHLDYWSD